ncbi:MAG: hypothetical protein EBT15_10950 [Betaproteobacteria bacterium]|nr:hypothetical protein [Betaproteobacteria bacterium]
MWRQGPSPTPEYVNRLSMTGPQVVHILRLSIQSPGAPVDLLTSLVVLKTGEVKASVGSNPTLSVE